MSNENAMVEALAELQNWKRNASIGQRNTSQSSMTAQMATAWSLIRAEGKLYGQDAREAPKSSIHSRNPEAEARDDVIAIMSAHHHGMKGEEGIEAPITVQIDTMRNKGVDKETEPRP